MQRTAQLPPQPRCPPHVDHDAPRQHQQLNAVEPDVNVGRQYHIFGVTDPSFGGEVDLGGGVPEDIDGKVGHQPGSHGDGVTLIEPTGKIAIDEDRQVTDPQQRPVGEGGCQGQPLIADEMVPLAGSAGVPGQQHVIEAVGGVPRRLFQATLEDDFVTGSLWE